MNSPNVPPNQQGFNQPIGNQPNFQQPFGNQQPNFNQPMPAMMPKKSGHEVLAAARADESLAGLKVLMLTAKGRDTDVAQGMGLGADAYMTKPFSTKDLAAKVRELLG